MYTITLEVNQICNFNCYYCYLDNKTGETMSWEVARKGLNIAFLNAQNHKDRRLWVDFVGGEALLSFSFLLKLTNYIDYQSKKKGLRVTYSITTNGSVLNEKILEWIIKKRIHIKISIDGEQHIHDKNRIWESGQGTYDYVINNILSLRNYEKKTGLRLQGNHVIAKNNYMEMFPSLRHMVDELKIEIIDSSIDFTVRWTKNELEVIVKEWEKIIQYYIQKKDDGEPFLWGMIVDMQSYCRESKCISCGVGLTKIYVQVNGKIYGCVANLNDRYCIGNVNDGINLKRITSFQDNANKNEMCRICNIRDSCTVKKCIMNSIHFSRGEKGFNYSACFLERKKQYLWRHFYECIKF